MFTSFLIGGFIISHRGIESWEFVFGCYPLALMMHEAKAPLILEGIFSFAGSWCASLLVSIYSRILQASDPHVFESFLAFEHLP